MFRLSGMKAHGQRKGARGFTLIEMLIVLALIGIITGIAIPAYLGQRRRARVIGDAIANAKVIAMELESWKADAGTYTPGATASWTYTTSVPHYGAPTLGVWTAASSPFRSFTPSGSSGISFNLVVDANGLTYTLDAIDPTVSAPGAPVANCVYRTNQTGAELFRAF